MTWKNRAKLITGFLVVLVIVAASTVIFNQRQLRSVSQSATIKADSYPVGTDYGGLVVRQYVNEGDEVSLGDIMFEVQSLQLERDLAIGAVTDSGDSIAADGTVSVYASVDGKVAGVDVEQGGFAQAGSVLARIDQAESMFVEADFLLSPSDFGRIESDALVELRLPDQRTLSGTVESLGVETVGGEAETTARVISDSLITGDDNGLVQPGTPIEATLYLRDDGPLAGVSDALQNFLRKIGL